MTPLNAAILAAAVLVLALTLLAIGATIAAGHHRHRANLADWRAEHLRTERDDALRDLAHERDRRPRGLAAATRSVRTKPLPRFARHDTTPTRIAREG